MYFGDPEFCQAYVMYSHDSIRMDDILTLLDK